MPSDSPPYIPPEVVDWLRRCFPDRLPNAPLAKEQYDVMVGQQQVIRRLQLAVEEQEGNLLNY